MGVLVINTVKQNQVNSWSGVIAMNILSLLNRIFDVDLEYGNIKAYFRRKITIV